MWNNQLWGKNSNSLPKTQWVPFDWSLLSFETCIESVRRIGYYWLCFCLPLQSHAPQPRPVAIITDLKHCNSFLAGFPDSDFLGGGWGNGANHVGQHRSGFGEYWVVQFQESNGFIAGNGRQVWKEISTVEKVLDLRSKFRWFGGHRGDFFFLTFEPVRWENNSIFVFSLRY